MTGVGASEVLSGALEWPAGRAALPTAAKREKTVAPSGEIAVAVEPQQIHQKDDVHVLGPGTIQVRP
eukprot:SAG31_NODE_1702_length_7496_cov_2.367311_2_plen_67_part_00